MLGTGSRGLQEQLEARVIKMSKSIFFSVGEPSGDQHAARMVSQILAFDSTIQLRGFGGQAMSQAGCCLDRDEASIGCC